MKSQIFALVLLGGAMCLSAQEKGEVLVRTQGAAAGAANALELKASAPVVGAPFTATINNESVQILADGNRIVHTTTGSTARDSEGRTRRDAELPLIGELAAANAPHFVFISDPVAQKSFTLNLTEKTARVGNLWLFEGMAGEKLLTQQRDKVPTTEAPTAGIPAEKLQALRERRIADSSGLAQVNVEDLGTQTMEGVLVTGKRMTRTIPAGKVGNEKPITIVSEVWTSPELKTVVMSKRNDPRMGEQTFRLTNIVRTEPDASLFAVPADFRMIEAEQPVIYKMKQ